MEIQRVGVKGPTLTQLIIALEQQFQDAYVIRRDGVHILATEEHYFRTGSLLMSVLIINRVEEHKHELIVLSGGGGTGFFGIDWGAERDYVKKTIATLREMCGAHEWSLTHPQSLHSSYER